MTYYMYVYIVPGYQCTTPQCQLIRLCIFVGLIKLMYSIVISRLISLGHSHLANVLYKIMVAIIEYNNICDTVCDVEYAVRSCVAIAEYHTS